MTERRVTHAERLAVHEHLIACRDRSYTRLTDAEWTLWDEATDCFRREDLTLSQLYGIEGAAIRWLKARG